MYTEERENELRRLRDSLEKRPDWKILKVAGFLFVTSVDLRLCVPLRSYKHPVQLLYWPGTEGARYVSEACLPQGLDEDERFTWAISWAAAELRRFGAYT